MRALMSLSTNFASTRASKGSIKQARNTYCFGLPASSRVVFEFVDHGEIIGHLNVSATIDAGIAHELASGPIIATTLSWEIRRCATVRAWSAFAPLSPMMSWIGSFVPPRSRPPAALTWPTKSSAAFFEEAPTAGISPVSSAFNPILTEGPPPLPHPANPDKASTAAKETTLFITSCEMEDSTFDGKLCFRSRGRSAIEETLLAAAGGFDTSAVP